MTLGVREAYSGDRIYYSSLPSSFSSQAAQAINAWLPACRSGSPPLSSRGAGACWGPGASWLRMLAGQSACHLTGLQDAFLVDASSDRLPAIVSYCSALGIHKRAALVATIHK